MNLNAEVTAAVIRGDLMAFTCIVARVEMNKNNAQYDDAGMNELAATLPKQPLTFKDHTDPTAVCGHFTDARVVQNNGALALEADAILFARRFPELAAGVRDGTYKLSIETWVGENECVECAAIYKTGDADTVLCEHLTASATPKRKIRKLTAFGGCLTKIPAGTNTIVYPETVRMVASVRKYDHLLTAAASTSISEFSEEPKPQAQKEGELLITKGSTGMKISCTHCGKDAERADIVLASEVSTVSTQLTASQASVGTLTAEKLAETQRAEAAEKELADFKASIEADKAADARVTEVAALIGPEAAEAQRETLRSFTEAQYSSFIAVLKTHAKPVDAGAAGGTGTSTASQQTQQVTGPLGVAGASQQQGNGAAAGDGKKKSIKDFFGPPASA